MSPSKSNSNFRIKVKLFNFRLTLLLKFINWTQNQLCYATQAVCKLIHQHCTCIDLSCSWYQEEVHRLKTEKLCEPFHCHKRQKIFIPLNFKAFKNMKFAQCTVLWCVCLFGHLMLQAMFNSLHLSSQLLASVIWPCCLQQITFSICSHTCPFWLKKNKIVSYAYLRSN
jgi:hypothetical protein